MRQPVSALLEKELRAELKQKGLLIWLDTDQSFTGFVDHLAQQHQRGEFPYAVLGFRGSYLELMLALEEHGNQLHPDKVLIHMPGFNEETIRETPLLEMYRAGKRHLEKPPHADRRSRPGARTARRRGRVPR